MNLQWLYLSTRWIIDAKLLSEEDNFLIGSVSTITAPQAVNNCMNQKIMNIYRHRRPNRKKKHASHMKCIFNNILMNRLKQQKKKMGDKRRGIGFETVAGIGGGYHRNTLGQVVLRKI